MIDQVPIVDEIYQHKDGNLYTVVKVVNDYKLSNGVVTNLVEYKLLDNDTIYIRRVSHFNSSFKKYNTEEA